MTSSSTIRAIARHRNADSERHNSKHVARVHTVSSCELIKLIPFQISTVMQITSQMLSSKLIVTKLQRTTGDFEAICMLDEFGT